MKIYKILISVLILAVVLAGCSTVDTNIQNDSNNTENTLPESNNETVDKTPLVPSLPVKPEIIPPTEIVKYDNLIQFNGTTNLYNSKGKYISTVYKNDYLPLVSSDKYNYITKFNHNTVYIKKNSNVSIKMMDKSSENIENMIDVAKSVLGTKYVYGAERYHFNGRKNSRFNKYYFDCSSLTQYAMFVSNGINIDTTSRGQSVQGKLVKKSQLSRGDLMFFTNSSRKHNTGINRIGHVGIYLGDNLILHTSSDYAIIENISSTRWSYYIVARRYI